MKKIIIYEGIKCCSSGLCGPNPDQKLIEFNEAVNKLKEENIAVKRVNLSSHIDFFKKNKNVMQKIQEEGVQTLPITTVNNKIVQEKKYPSYEELKNL